MSDTVWLAIIASVPPTLVALAGLVVSIGNRWKTDETKAVVHQVEAKVSAVDTKAVEIKTLADGHLSKVTNELSNANIRIEGLEKLMSAFLESRRSVEFASAQNADLLKQAMTTSPAQPVASTQDGVAQSLENIDTSTKATEINTRKTDLKDKS